MARLFDRPVTFLKSVVGVDQLPNWQKVELAFLGRSNVGKSTLINQFVGDKNLCKTSKTPGRTQMLNFFEVKDLVYLVDMPGYGFAKAPKSVVKKWQGLIPDYLMGRQQLKRLFLLIDSRHGIKDIDDAYMDFLDRSAVSYQVVLTKIDKISEAEQQAVLAQTVEALKKHGAAYPEVLLTSSQKGTGIVALKAAMKKVIDQG
ncbi:ribosome biogenesis GTP-binding protein YihA/YsxC [Alphaproteobacteria bacterium]|nr:ribosome biogenesis GTP-binding protein YihA/YsxC [Alphaproteobacteria bacterium]